MALFVPMTRNKTHISNKIRRENELKIKGNIEENIDNFEDKNVA